MSTAETEKELRRIWGASYDQKLDMARGAYDAMSEDAKDRIDGYNPAQVQMLAAMKSEAYTNPKHPDHAAVSQQVGKQFDVLFGSDPAVL